MLSYQWARRVRFGIALWSAEVRHWTLTLPGAIRTPTQGFFVLKRGWENLRKSMQRSVGTWHYATFVELHPKRFGIAHCHIISLANAPYRLKDLAHHSGFGYQAKDDPVSGKEAAYYVTKYTSKQGSQMPKGFHRVRLSQRWPKFPEPEFDAELLPQHHKEPLFDYITRVASVVGLPVETCRTRWLDKSQDL